MHNPSTSHNSAPVASFWRKYLSLLESHGVPERARPWYRRRVEEYLEAHSGAPVRSHGREQVKDYLQVLGRNTALEDWQYRQAVDALRILFCDLLTVPWGTELDWGYWMRLSRALPETHPTIAREGPPTPPAERKRTAEASLQKALGKRAPALRDKVVSGIRTRGYAIRTEQTYLDWIARFLSFHGWCAAESLGRTAITAFLEHLALERKVSASTQNQALNAPMWPRP